ncbi:kinesin-related protein 12-like [Schistocerca gregaria]|uniref:kinesin-related protein 12-like n=1 Tax=Schistocerca gregaria TaxID=7010 RepID=UPI00211E15A7|nr:kinesin-related protein 12-like [Schistocerca gregaria]
MDPDSDAEQVHPIEVVLRIRPIKQACGTGSDSSSIIVASGLHTIKVCNPNPVHLENGDLVSINKSTEYKFDWILPETSSQEDVWKRTCPNLLRQFLSGKNVLLFCYGPSASGKTFTMQGDEENPGLLPRILKYLFASIQQAKAARNENQQVHNDLQKKKWCPLSKEKDGLDERYIVPLPVDAEYRVWTSYYECYNEKIYDLLKKPSQETEPLEVHMLNDRNEIRNLKEVAVNDVEQAIKVFSFGASNRRVAETCQNRDSSRSHGIFTIKLMQMPVGLPAENFGNPSYVKLSKFSVIDLAGSERFSKSNVEGKHIKESNSINNSLFVLGRCMEALRHNQSMAFRRLQSAQWGGDEQHGDYAIRRGQVDCGPNERYSPQEVNCRGKNGVLGPLMGKVSNRGSSIQGDRDTPAMSKKEGLGPQPQVVPFRDSLLTKIFREFFLGEGKIVMVVNIHPSAADAEETIRALSFGTVSKNVMTTCKKNVVPRFRTQTQLKPISFSLTGSSSQKQKCKVPLRESACLNDGRGSPTSRWNVEAVKKFRDETDKGAQGRRQRMNIELIRSILGDENNAGGVLKGEAAAGEKEEGVEKEIFLEGVSNCCKLLSSVYPAFKYGCRSPTTEGLGGLDAGCVGVEGPLFSSFPMTAEQIDHVCEVFRQMEVYIQQFFESQIVQFWGHYEKMVRRYEEDQKELWTQYQALHEAYAQVEEELWRVRDENEHLKESLKQQGEEVQRAREELVQAMREKGEQMAQCRREYDKMMIEMRDQWRENLDMIKTGMENVKAHFEQREMMILNQMKKMQQGADEKKSESSKIKSRSGATNQCKSETESSIQDEKKQEMVEREKSNADSSQATGLSKLSKHYNKIFESNKIKPLIRSASAPTAASAPLVQENRLGHSFCEEEKKESCQSVERGVAEIKKSVAETNQSLKNSSDCPNLSTCLAEAGDSSQPDLIRTSPAANPLYQEVPLKLNAVDSASISFSPMCTSTPNRSSRRGTPLTRFPEESELTAAACLNGESRATVSRSPFSEADHEPVSSRPVSPLRSSEHRGSPCAVKAGTTKKKRVKMSQPKKSDKRAKRGNLRPVKESKCDQVCFAKDVTDERPTEDESVAAAPSNISQNGCSNNTDLSSNHCLSGDMSPPTRGLVGASPRSSGGASLEDKCSFSRPSLVRGTPMIKRLRPRKTLVLLDSIDNNTSLHSSVHAKNPFDFCDETSKKSKKPQNRSRTARCAKKSVCGPPPYLKF